MCRHARRTRRNRREGRRAARIAFISDLFKIITGNNSQKSSSSYPPQYTNEMRGTTQYGTMAERSELDRPKIYEKVILDVRPPSYNEIVNEKSEAVREK